MLLVPRGHQLIYALADVLAVDDVTGEGAHGVERLDEAHILAQVGAQHAIQLDGGPEGAQPIQLDGDALAVEEDNGLVHLREHVADLAPVEACAPGDILAQLEGAYRADLLHQHGLRLVHDLIPCCVGWMFGLCYVRSRVRGLQDR
jgi:hypothetical protein